MIAARPMRLPISMWSDWMRKLPPDNCLTPRTESRLGTDASDVSAQGNEEVAEILDVRLAGSIANQGFAVGGDRREYGVLGAGNRRLVQEEVGPP